MNEEVLFTTSAVIDLLSQIDELSDKSLQVDEMGNGDISISLGDSSYLVETSSAESVEVPEETISEISEIDESNLSELQESGAIEEVEPVEGGIISETIKTLAVGGLVRLAGKLMK